MVKRQILEKLRLVDKESPPGRLVKYNLKSGMVIDTSTHSNPLLLLIRLFHYGGAEFSAELDVSY